MTKKIYKQLEFSFNYTEPLLTEVMDRTLKDVSPERRQAIAQEMAWAIHPDNSKFKYSEIPHELFEIYEPNEHLITTLVRHTLDTIVKSFQI